MTTEVKYDYRTFPAKKDTEDWLRSHLYGLTGKCWKLSYTSKNRTSQSEVIFASCDGVEIPFCDGEPQTHAFLLQRIAECTRP